MGKATAAQEPLPLTNELPLDSKKLRARLRRYERELHEEKRELGCYGDGSGKRYKVGPMYLLLGDLEGALASFRWFEQEFPDDSLMPEQCLCWTLARLRGGDEAGALLMLRATMLRNLYVLPALFDEPIVELDIWHGCNTEEPSYIKWIPPAYFALWTPAERRWAETAYQGAELVRVRTRYIEIFRELKSLSPGPRRTQLVKEARALEHPGLGGTDART